jgi:hypothetical protein
VSSPRATRRSSAYRRYLKTISEDRFAIDHAKAEEDAKFDGIFVLRTNTDLNPLCRAAPHRYRSGWFRNDVT